MSLVLGLRSWYSYEDGFLSPEDAVAAAKQAGAKCVAFADKGEMASFFEFVQACEKHGLSYIPGIEVNLACQGETRPAVLFGLRVEGEKKLWELLSTSKLMEPGTAESGVPENLPVVPVEALNKTILVLSGQNASHMMAYRRRREVLSAKDFHAAIEGTGARFAFAADPETFEPQETQFFQSMVDAKIRIVPYRPSVLASLAQLPDYQAVGQVVFKAASESASYEIPLIQTASALAKRGNLPFCELSDLEKLVAGAAITPVPLPSATHGDLAYKGLPPDETLAMLRERCKTNFIQFLRSTEKKEGRGFVEGSERPKYQERLEKELAVISTLKFQSRLLLMADLVSYCRDNGQEAFARGSAANSVVCWMLGISKVDPVAANLPFERFLNPERPSMPDVDIDIPKSFGDRAFAFLQSHVPHSARIRQPRDTSLGDSIVKLAHHFDVRNPEKLGEAFRSKIGVSKFAKGLSVSDLEAQVPDLRAIFVGLREDSSDKMAEIYNLLHIIGRRPLGFNPHVGLAACDVPVESKIPVLPMRLPNGKVVQATGLVHSELEKHGVLKFDLLPRKSLDWMRRVFDRSKGLGELPTMDDAAAFQPKAAFELIRRGFVAGIDQIHKHSETLKTLKIHNFSGLCTFIALIRPGATGGEGHFDDDPRPAGVVRYLRKKSPLNNSASSLGPEAAAIFKEVTHDTPGMVIYQEQFTDLLHKMSGISFASCDLIRGAIAKKKKIGDKITKTVISKIATKFGVKDAVAAAFFQNLAGEGDYLFPKGHAATYAVAAIHQLSIKNLVPGSFVAGYIDHARMDEWVGGGEFKEKLAAIVGDVRQQGLAILPMDFSKSLLTSVEGEAFSAPPLQRRLRLGLDAISTVSNDEIERVRKNIGIYQSEIAADRPPTPERMMEAPFFLNPDTVAKAALLMAFSFNKQVPARKVAATIAPSIKSNYLSTEEAAFSLLGFVPDGIHPGLPTELRVLGQRVPEPVISVDAISLYEKSGDASKPEKPFYVAGFLTEQPKKWARAKGCTIEFTLGSLRGPKPHRIKMLFFPSARDKADAGRQAKLAAEADAIFARLDGHFQKQSSTPIIVQVKKDIYLGRAGLMATSRRIDVAEKAATTAATQEPIEDISQSKPIATKEHPPLTARRPGDT